MYDIVLVLLYAHFKNRVSAALQIIILWSLEHKNVSKHTRQQLRKLLDPDNPTLQPGCLFVGQDASESQTYHYCCVMSEL